MPEYLHASINKPYIRRLFSELKLGDTVQELTYIMKYSVDDDFDAEYIFKELRKKHIIVRYFNAPRINQYLRVTIGNDEEMDAFLEAVKEIIQAS